MDIFSILLISVVALLLLNFVIILVAVLKFPKISKKTTEYAVNNILRGVVSTQMDVKEESKDYSEDIKDIKQELKKEKSLRVRYSVDYTPVKLSHKRLCMFVNGRCEESKCYSFVEREGRFFCNSHLLEFTNYLDKEDR